ncbi:Prolyl tripeptidyl peptidase precursor [compost metagenome]
MNRGYLVFIPDMFYTTGQNGKGILATISSAVKFLSQFSWVDVQRMGLQGHSFGGYETNYLITHTNLFAAAQEIAGQSNLVSGYGWITPSSGSSRHILYEKAQGNLPCPPWDCPNLYVENTPIFKIGDVTTPLMMVHNKNDNAVPFYQAIEFFTGLRRAKKKAWLVEYDNEGHLVMDANNREDLTIRTQQFFDHYLKGAKPPIWMTEGLATKYKEVKSGLQLDSLNRIP